MKENLAKALTDAVDVTNQGINKVVGATTGFVVTAASNTPGLKNIVKPHVHWYVQYIDGSSCIFVIRHIG